MSPRAEPDIKALFREYRDSGDRHVRNRIVEAHLHLADYYVSRFSRSVGTSSDDLRQTALMAIIHAVERFDPDLGVSFRTFASRTMEGELKRYLRDKSWAVRPPRRAQELHLRIRRASEELSQRLGRSATVAELAEELGESEEHVLEGLEAGRARAADRLDPVPRGEDDRAGSVLDRVLGALDPSFGSVEQRLVLRAAIANLDEREQEVLQLRFVEDLSQPEIAELIGVSQSYVSRILRGTLAQLRTELVS